MTDGQAPDATLAPPPPRGEQARLWGRSLLYSLAGIGVLVAGEGVFLWFYHPPGREPLGALHHGRSYFRGDVASRIM